MKSRKSTWRATMEEIACLLLRFTMIPWFLREVYARRKVTIINYHDPLPEVFEKHLKYFLRHYSVIPISDLIWAVTENKWSSLRPKALVISFDDGHAGNARLLPILQSYPVPVILYLTAGLVNTNRRFWFQLESISTDDKRLLKSVDDDTRRRILKRAFWHTDQTEFKQRAVLTNDEVNKLVHHGVIVGSHTVYHPLLSMCRQERIRFELEESKRILERTCGVRIQHFAYPDGSWTWEIASMVEAAGYLSARTTDPGWMTRTGNRYALPNFGISDAAGINKAIVQASGLWYLIKRRAKDYAKGVRDYPPSAE